MTYQPVVLLGWDSASPDMVRRLIDDGRLPELAAILDGGAWTQINGFPGLGDDGNWASIATGVRPEVHGRLNWIHAEPDSYDTVSVAASDVIDVEPFWSDLAQNGRTAFVLDMPKGPLSTRGNVEQVADWTVHGGDGLDTVTFPAELAATWVAERGETSADLCFVGDEPVAELATAIDQRRQMVTDALVDKISVDQPDLVVGVYAAAHCRSHRFWHLHDDGLPDGDVIVEQLIALDRDLGRLRVASPTARFAVYAPLGMGPTNHHDDVIRQALERLSEMVGVAVPGSVRAPLQRHRFSKLGRRVYNTVTNRLPARAKQACDAACSAMPFAEREIVFRRRVQAFSVIEQNSVSTPIRLNIIDREPNGVVHRHAVSDVLTWLSGELMKIVDTETGQPILDECVVVADEYPGEHAEVWVDLLACWSLAPAVDRVVSPIVGEITRDVVRWRTGEHRSTGWMITSAGLDIDESLVGSAGIDPAGIAPLVGQWCEAAR